MWSVIDGLRETFRGAGQGRGVGLSGPRDLGPGLALVWPFQPGGVSWSPSRGQGPPYGLLQPAERRDPRQLRDSHVQMED